jgi:hypothetical protein
MSWLSKLTVKPLLYVVAAQLAVIVAMSGWMAVEGARHDAETARLQGRITFTAGQRDIARTETEAWKRTAETLQAAAVKWDEAVGTLQSLLRDAQGERRRLDAEGRAAIAAAEARATDADRTLAAWTRRYAEQVRVGDCAAALNAVQTACPALEDY